MLRRAYPPLSLRDISPTRGEIGRERPTFLPTLNEWRKQAPALTPLVGDMSGRTEGGAAALTGHG